MRKFRNKLFLGLAFLAFFSFTAIFVGGEAFHAKIHHHEDASSQEQCPIHQLQAQLLTVLPAIALVLFLRATLLLITDRPAPSARHQYDLPPLRAPPTSLS